MAVPYQAEPGTEEDILSDIERKRRHTRNGMFGTLKEISVAILGTPNTACKQAVAQLLQSFTRRNRYPLEHHSRNNFTYSLE